MNLTETGSRSEAFQGAAASEAIHEVQIDRAVPVRMRDGVSLRADIYRPRTDGEYPVLIERVGYERSARCAEPGKFFAHRGYVFVGQSVRGLYGSEGEYRPFMDDGWGLRRDGYDTIEWAAQQPWSSGAVGMLDGSFSGYTQYLAAVTGPPHLRALCVRAGPLSLYDIWVYRGGAHQFAVREWAIKNVLLPQFRDPASPTRECLEQAAQEFQHWCEHVPVRSCPPLEGVGDWYMEWLAHPTYDAYWKSLDVSGHFEEIGVPAVHLTGWFDVALDASLRAFNGLRERALTAEARSSQRLVIGPWQHGPMFFGQRCTGELDFGPEAEFILRLAQLRWYDYWLKGLDNGVLDGPPVLAFLMGANRWLGLDSWPPAGVSYQPAYFKAGSGRDGTSLSNGLLAFEAPGPTEPPDTLAYDPQAPVPSLLGYPDLGPRDHRSVEPNMLTYTSAPLERDLTVIGPVKAVLYIRSSAPDTDFVVRLCDVWPDGRSMNVCDGILRARYRTSFEEPELMRPGEVYRLEVDLWSTAQVFAATHRLRVEVTSSDFPRFDRNLNTGGPLFEETEGKIASNTIFHDPTRPSHIVLPLLDEARLAALR